MKLLTRPIALCAPAWAHIDQKAALMGATRGQYITWILSNIDAKVPAPDKITVPATWWHPDYRDEA